MYPPSPHSSDATFILLGPQAVPVDIPNAAARVCTRSINSTLFESIGGSSDAALRCQFLFQFPCCASFCLCHITRSNSAWPKRTRGRITDVVLVSKRADLALDSARRE